MRFLTVVLLLACSAPPPLAPFAAVRAVSGLSPEVFASARAPAHSDSPDRPDRAVPPRGPDRPLGLTYEIYVRSFQDSDGDGIGDFDGVRSRLDHLEKLGVQTLWLMPAFPSVGPAGYDVTDFDAIRGDYGGEDALVRLVDDAHGRGMRVLLDLPLNHVARSHPWFVAAEADSTSPDRRAFVFADRQWDDVRWFTADGGGWYYALFGSELPDLDWREPDVRTRMEAMHAQWLDVVDGYRLDAVNGLVEEADAITDTAGTHELLAELAASGRVANPDAVYLAEAGADTEAVVASYLGAAEAPESDRVIDFPRQAAMLSALSAGDPQILLAVLQATEAAGSLGRTAPFLSSHDLPRLPTQLPDVRQRRLAEVLALTLPGDPILYYGEEIDLPDASTATGQDYAWRAPMAWDASSTGGFTSGTPWFTPDPGFILTNAASEAADPRSVLVLIQDLACVREAIEGSRWAAVETDNPSMLAFARATEAGSVIIVANLSGNAVANVRVDHSGTLWELTAQARDVDATEGLRIAELPPFGYAVYGDAIAGGCAVAGP